MGEATKSSMECRSCGTSKHVIRLKWEDDCGGPTVFYDDHVCLECGRYASQGGCSLGEESLKHYRREYGHVVIVKRFLDMLWASLPEAWETEAMLGSEDDGFVEVRFVNPGSGKEFRHRFDAATVAKHWDDLGEWARRRAKAILREKG